MNEMSILIQSATFKLAFGILACAMAWSMLRLLDWSLGVRFGNIHGELCKGNIAVALYYGLRFIGSALLVGMALG